MIADECFVCLGQIDYYVWPVPLTAVIYTPGNGDTFAIKEILYDGIGYSSVQDVVDAYATGNIRDIKPGAHNNHENG